MGWQETFGSASTLDPSFPADIDDVDVELHSAPMSS